MVLLNELKVYLNKKFQILKKFLRLPKSFRSSRPEVFLVKGVLKICSKFTGEHPCRNVISRKLQAISHLVILCNFSTFLRFVLLQPLNALETRQ